MAITKKTIVLKGYTDIYNEYDADAGITPGMLLEITATGVKVHADAGGVSEKLFAVEDALQGRTIDNAYVADDPVRCKNCVPGEEIFAFLSNGESVAVDAKLVSDGAGALQAFEAGSSGQVDEEYAIAIALEAVDMSGSSGVDPTGRIKVRIL